MTLDTREESDAVEDALGEVGLLTEIDTLTVSDNDSIGDTDPTARECVIVLDRVPVTLCVFIEDTRAEADCANERIVDRVISLDSEVTAEMET